MARSIRVALLAAAVAASLTAAPRQLHVALLGDSLAYGVGDETGKGIGGRLGPELRSRGVGSTVTKNLGANGATTRDVAAALQQRETRAALARADVIILSVGANDLKLPLSRQEPLLTPLAFVNQVLRNIEGIVAEIRTLNPRARIFILGAYAPVPRERAAVLLEPLVAIWDNALMTRFAGDPLITVVQISDIIDRPERLSTIDSFHPGGEAYQETARRIAELLASEERHGADPRR